MFNPAPTFEGVCDQLRSAIGTVARERESAQFNTQLDQEDNQAYDEEVYDQHWTDRTYEGRGRGYGRGRHNQRGRGHNGNSHNGSGYSGNGHNGMGYRGMATMAATTIGEATVKEAEEDTKAFNRRNATSVTNQDAGPTSIP